MHRFLIMALLLVNFAIGIHAQTYQVSGSVINDANNQPLSGASVFINNASKGTTSNKDGAFLISNISSSNFELVISFVSFETIVIRITPENINKRFRVEMTAKGNELKEIVIGPADKDGWKKWGKMFTEFFIGMSDNAKQCIIKNPQVLTFRYNKKSHVLRVTALDKLIIENRGLGLMIDYQLEEFVYDSNEGMTTFFGYTSFDTMKSNRKNKMDTWRAKRRDAYNGSLMHFMRAFYQNKTWEEGFEMRQLIRIRIQDSSTRNIYDRLLKGDMSVYDTAKFSMQLMRGSGLGSPIIYIIGKKPLQADSIRIVDTLYKAVYLAFYNDVMIEFKNELEKSEYALQQNPSRKNRQYQHSIIQLRNSMSVTVDKYGNYYEPLDVFTEGYWAWEKMAETLPIDYEPGE